MDCAECGEWLECENCGDEFDSEPELGVYLCSACEHETEECSACGASF